MKCIATKKFVAGFSVAAFGSAFLNLLPYFRTRGAYHGDGFEVIGFPFSFRTIGGIAGVHEFSMAALLADVTLALAVAVFAGYAWSRISRRD
ncbi:MAG: hypothetical protein AB1705_19775 [Verrucomicrobiota bacterium]